MWHCFSLPYDRERQNPKWLFRPCRPVILSARTQGGSLRLCPGLDSLGPLGHTSRPALRHSAELWKYQKCRRGGKLSESRPRTPGTYFSHASWLPTRISRAEALVRPLCVSQQEFCSRLAHWFGVHALACLPVNRRFRVSRGDF